MKWYNIIIVVLIILGTVFVQRKFFPTVNTVIHTDTTIIKVDSIIYKEKLVPYVIKVPEVDTVIIAADSAKIVARYLALHREYYTTKYFKDSVKVDSIGTISTSFRVFTNSVFDYKLEYSLEKKKIVTQIVANPKNSLYIGGQIGLNQISPLIIFNQKDKIQYFVGYNLIGGGVNVGVAVNVNKIKLW